MFHSVYFHGKRILEYMWIYAADVISRRHFQEKTFSGDEIIEVLCTDKLTFHLTGSLFM